MKSSLDIKDLAKALAEAQKDIQSAHKDKKNPFYNSTYADLNSTWDACRAPLTKNGLSVTQTTESLKDDTYVITRLMHTSGQWIESRMKLILPKRDMQGLGTAITYARRYHLQAIAGVAPADGDGNSIVAEKEEKKGTAKPAAKPPVAKEGEKKEGSGADYQRFKAKKDLMKKAITKFKSEDEFQVWRTDNNLPETLDKITPEEVKDIDVALDKVKDKKK